jgi:hypothetical protein
MIESNWSLLVVIFALALTASEACAAPSRLTRSRAFADLVGKPADVAPSAYRYRADCKPEANDPESWFAVKYFARIPVNKPVDLGAPAVKSVSTALLWEEIRPIEKLELVWPADAKRVPPASRIAISTLDAQGSASSWWNNLTATTRDIRPTASPDGRTYTYELAAHTCGIVVSVIGTNPAASYDVPEVRAFVSDKWKVMDVELEWGFDASTAGKDYGGGLEAYDGRLGELNPLQGDSTTAIEGTGVWKSDGSASARRGVKFTLLYMGISKWRKEMPFTTQREDVARTVVTVRTKSGSFSFLAADLENGPVLAPEYGFFVRRTSSLPAKEPTPPEPRTPIKTVMNSIAQDPNLQGWGSDDTPWFGGNPTDTARSPQCIDFPAKAVAMHPGRDLDVAVEWRSPIAGTVSVKASVKHAQHGGNGIAWSVIRDREAGREVLAHGVTDGSGSQSAPNGPDQSAKLGAIHVAKGDRLALVIAPKSGHEYCTTLLGFTISEVGVQARVWDLATDVIGSLQAGNPHADSFGNPDVWAFCAASRDGVQPSEPPFSLASNAASGKEFENELAARKLAAIRERVRAHPEQTWEGAVTAMRGSDLPPHPAPPQGSEPAMEVHVPSERLTAQWNLGAWHLTRHCGINPRTGELWFNDYPYGILGAETYMVLRVLDLIGEHKAAEDGFYQWVSLPMDTDAGGQHPWAMKDHPSGLFTEGHGCLTAAVGPDGYGGQMDGVHAFGPGSIGWALTEHYWMTGDKEWLRKYAARIIAGAEWMLRQRKVIADSVPGGERLWCKGLQPAMQVTPDSGGLWMNFYECEAYYWAFVARWAETLAEVDSAAGARLRKEAESYGRDLRAAVDRSITLSPVVPVRDGTFHSVVPFACYVRGQATGAWGWEREGSGGHVGPLYWDTVQSAAALISPAGLLPTKDPRVQGYLDVLEDRDLLENPNADKKDWFDAGWQYQGGLERTPNMHLADDDVPVFLRSFLNCYAVDILPHDEYVFNEHAVHGPPDKIFEEAAFLERMRCLLVMEDGPKLWLARATPRAWLTAGETISVQHAPTKFGTVGYEIVSHFDRSTVSATVTLPDRDGKPEVWLRLRTPDGRPMKSVTVDGKPWKDFDAKLEVVKLHGLRGTVQVEVQY